MAFKRKRTYVKRPFKKTVTRTSIRTRRGNARRRIVARVPRRLLQPFPDTRLVRHKYADTILLPAAGAPGVPVTWSFRANSMYDPDYTGLGHQPMFHDEMAAQYRFYTVMRSWIKVTFPNDANITQNLFLFCDSDFNSPTNFSNMLEQHRGVLGTKLNPRSGPVVLKGWFDAAKWDKTTRQAVLADIDQKTAAGNNPTLTAQKYFNVVAFPTKLSETLGSQTVVVELTYECQWRDPVDHVGS